LKLAGSLSMLAHPANLIYAKKHLDQDIQYYKQHVMGTGPFKLKEYVRGSLLEVERNPDYFKKGVPYLDGIKYYMMPDTSARANSIRSGRTDVEFRSLPPAEVEVMFNYALTGDPALASPNELTIPGLQRETVYTLDIEDLPTNFRVTAVVTNTVTGVLGDPGIVAVSNLVNYDVQFDGSASFNATMLGPEFAICGGMC
jgi:ABC-type transport system substrate-binding protein